MLQVTKPTYVEDLINDPNFNIDEYYINDIRNIINIEMNDNELIQIIKTYNYNLNNIILSFIYI